MKKILFAVLGCIFIWSVFVEPSLIRTVSYDVSGIGRGWSEAERPLRSRTLLRRSVRFQDSGIGRGFLYGGPPGSASARRFRLFSGTATSHDCCGLHTDGPSVSASARLFRLFSGTATSHDCCGLHTDGPSVSAVLEYGRCGPLGVGLRKGRSFQSAPSDSASARLFRLFSGTATSHDCCVVAQEAHARGAGKRIVFISDLHLSKRDKKRLERIVDRVNALKPDIVLLGGDYVKWDASDSIPLDVLSAGLARLNAKDGVYAVRGNHDSYYEDYAFCAGSGAECKAVNAVTDALESAGVRVLVNDNVEVDGLFIAGVDDVKTGSPDLKKALRGASPDKTVLLSHSPYIIKSAARTWGLRDDARHTLSGHVGQIVPDLRGYYLGVRQCLTYGAPEERDGSGVDGLPLILAGHTHGGQVRIPFIGAVATSDGWGDGFSYGAYRFGRTLMIVTSGLGTTFLPVRFNCLPEIVVVNLR